LQPADATSANDSGTSIRVGYVSGQASVAGGNTVPSTDTDLSLVAIEHLDTGAGAGFRGAAFGYSWDLTEDEPMAQTSHSYLSLYPHFTALASNGVLRVPIRIGPEIRLHELDQRIGVIGETSYRMFGVAAEIEPEWTFVNSDNFAASVYGQMHFGAGWGTINGGVKEDTTNATNFGGEVGIRLQASAVSLGFGFRGQQTRFRSSDDGMGGRDPETEFDFSGVFITLGAVF
jgi:hypothetical protein